MDDMMQIAAGQAGWLVWLVWALLGVFIGLWFSRATGPGTTSFNITIGVVAALIGGYLSICFLGDTPMQLFLISLLGAVFFALAALFIVARLLRFYRKK